MTYFTAELTRRIKLPGGMEPQDLGKKADTIKKPAVPAKEWQMRNMVLLAALALSGCVGTRLSNGLEAYLNHDIRDMVARLGYPDGERTIMGDHLYVWSTNRTGLLPVTSLSTTTGSVGGMPYYGNTTSTGFMPMQMQCTIELAVDRSNRITHYQWHGNPAGCAHYANRLEK